MKKYLIFLITFFSIFIFSNNVKAISNSKIIFDYDSSYVRNSVLTSSNIDFINNTLIPYLDSSSTRSQFEYLILINTNSVNTSPVSVYFFKPLSGTAEFVISNFIRNGYTSGFTFNITSAVNSSGLANSFYSTHRYYKEFTSLEVSNNDVSGLNSFLQDPTNNMQTTGNNTGPTSIYFTNSGALSYISVNNNNDITQYSSVSPTANNNLIYYCSINAKMAFKNNDSNVQYTRNIDVIYGGETYSFVLGDTFPTYKNFIDNLSVTVNKVIDLGNNSFGFFQDYVGLNLTSLSGAVDTLSVVCEQDRPFNNNYCFINYNDLINHNSDINVFNDYGVSFTQLFGSNTGYLLNDRYYLYSFRIQKPFVPQVGNLFINSLTSNSNQVDILGVYLQDGGSYTDYVIKFKISNSDYTSSTSLNDITVVFRDGLSSYFSIIPTSFNYSVYRSFKLQYFSTEPTMEQVNNFYNFNDLSSIDGISSNNSFFTDNDFNTFGFGGIITAPFRFLYAIENYESCSDIVLPFPHSNNTITLACVRNSIPSSINPLISILQIILSGFISYRIAVETLSIIKDISSPDVANIEVVDL